MIFIRLRNVNVFFILRIALWLSGISLYPQSQGRELNPTATLRSDVMIIMYYINIIELQE